MSVTFCIVSVNSSLLSQKNLSVTTYSSYKSLYLVSLNITWWYFKITPIFILYSMSWTTRKVANKLSSKTSASLLMYQLAKPSSLKCIQYSHLKTGLHVSIIIYRYEIIYEFVITITHLTVKCAQPARADIKIGFVFYY